MSAKGTRSAPEPFASDWLRLLGPLVTERALELARGRIAEPQVRLVGEKGALPGTATAGEVKAALLLVRHMNALEWLTNEEEAFLRGITAATYAKRLGEEGKR